MRIVIIIFFCGYSFLGFSQQITGNVKDILGEALPGVTVKIQGKAQGTVTDMNGVYKIAAERGDKLVFSFLSMKTVSKIVGDRNIINVTMEEGAIELEEVVAVGYGVRKKSDLTGSVSSIGRKDMESRYAVNVEQLIQGQVAGVRVSANSGAPGEGLQILIRGGNSMNGSNEPLYVVDGFPIETNPNETAGDPTSGDAGQYNNILSTLSPNDIEHIEILKDASATAIYGSKGANGVVIITTKKGENSKGKDVINVGYSFSISEVSRKIPMLEPWEWAQYYNQATVESGAARHLFNGATDGNGIYWPSIDDIKYQRNTVYGPWGIDWQDEIFRPAETHNLILSARGGNDKTIYAVSGTMLFNEGIVDNTNYDRFTLKGSVERTLSNSFKINASGQFARSVGNQKPTAGNTTANEGVIINSLRYNNVFPAYMPNGSYFNMKGTSAEDEDDVNINQPLVFIRDAKNQLKNTDVMTSLGLEWKPIKNLSLRSTLNLKHNMSVRDVYFPQTTQQGMTNSGLSANSWSESTLLVNENYANYHFTLNKKHDFELMAGESFEQNNLRTLAIRVQDFFSDDLQGMDLSEGAQQQPLSNTNVQTRMLSFFGRINYTFHKKYLLTATMRADGSSKFGANNKWAEFPSFAAAWRASDEDFLKNATWLSNLKLRVGYGFSGSQAIKPYQSLNVLVSEGYYFGKNYKKGIGIVNYSWTSTGGSYTGLGEPDLKWETTGQFDVGVDVGFKKNKYNLVVDFYNKVTKDLHQMVELPFESGYSATVRNMGSIQNRGLEVSFNGHFKFNKVRWTPSVNYSMNRNKVLDLGGYSFVEGPALVSGDGGSPFIGHISVVGHPMSSFYGYKTDGIIQTQAQADQYKDKYYIGTLAPGEVNYVDMNGDGNVNKDDQVILGNPNPDFEINFNNMFAWKRFEFSLNISGVYGNDVLNANLTKIESGTGNKVETARMRESWTIYNASNTQPRISGMTRNKIMSDRYIEDGSFIKLKNIMISYNFNMKKYKWISKAQLYLKGNNLVTLTKYTGYDPEVNQYQNNQKPGVDNGSYPSTRTFTIGMSLGF